MQRIERDAQIPQRAVEPERDGHGARAHPETLRGNCDLLEAVRFLDFEVQRLLIEVERQIVLISDHIVDSRHVVPAGLHAHTGPIERLARDDRRSTVAAFHAPTGEDGVEQNGFCDFRCGSGHAARTFKTARRFRSILRTASV